MVGACAVALHDGYTWPRVQGGASDFGYVIIALGMSCKRQQILLYLQDSRANLGETFRVLEGGWEMVKVFGQKN